MRKPRTVTGRVALRLCDAVLGPAIGGIRRMDAESSHIFMAVAFQATQQGLDPQDLDNDNGTAALEAIHATVARGSTAMTRDDTRLAHWQNAWDHFLYITAEWRRVVVSALRVLKRDGGYVRNPDEGRT